MKFCTDYFSKVAQIKKADNKQNSPATSAKLSDLKNREVHKVRGYTYSQPNEYSKSDG